MKELVFAAFFLVTPLRACGWHGGEEFSYAEPFSLQILSFSHLRRNANRTSNAPVVLHRHPMNHFNRILTADLRLRRKGKNMEKSRSRMPVI